MIRAMPEEPTTDEPQMSEISTVQSAVADALNASTWMAANEVSWYYENSLDIDFQIRNALERQGLACCVLTPSLTFTGLAKQYQGEDARGIAYDFDPLVLEIAENPIVNRAREGAVTALDIAHEAAKALCNSDSATQSVFNLKTIEQNINESLLIVQVSLSCTMVLN